MKKMPPEIREAIGFYTATNPGPFAPPAGHSFFRGGVTRIRIDPDGTVDVFRWPNPDDSRRGQPTTTLYIL